MKKPGDKVVVHSYKHDETLHRIWANAHVVDHKEDTIVIANHRTKVIEANGRFWFTKEPSVTWFFKDHWFNIIGILRPTGIFYYCNIASPFLIDDEALKYIDYDLDVKVMPDHTYRVLDRGEYNKHKNKMDYPTELKAILEKELSLIKEWIELKKGPFNHDNVTSYYHTFKSLQGQH